MFDRRITRISKVCKYINEAERLFTISKPRYVRMDNNAPLINIEPRFFPVNKKTEPNKIENQKMRFNMTHSFVNGKPKLIGSDFNTCPPKSNLIHCNR